MVRRSGSVRTGFGLLGVGIGDGARDVRGDAVADGTAGSGARLGALVTSGRASSAPPPSPSDRDHPGHGAGGHRDRGRREHRAAPGGAPALGPARGQAPGT
ncbi:hypothetical protein GCM10010121_007860 [Streptomyces brasiliensis]|uniref:Uncharacterized protein n=1 Tax=Streptomyces brasiliensis TaxID=1954 RepID=A0A917K423_9ACTN|nr:hypothetical protein GCM10010121_007860 [Streptomyces brasiliensis]